MINLSVFTSLPSGWVLSVPSAVECLEVGWEVFSVYRHCEIWAAVTTLKQVPPSLADVGSEQSFYLPIVSDHPDCGMNHWHFFASKPFIQKQWEIVSEDSCLILFCKFHDFGVSEWSGYLLYKLWGWRCSHSNSPKSTCVWRYKEKISIQIPTLISKHVHIFCQSLLYHPSRNHSTILQP